MLSVHITKGVSETPDAAKAVFAQLENISPVFDGLGNLVEGMSIEGVGNCAKKKPRLGNHHDGAEHQSALVLERKTEHANDRK